MYQVEDDDNIAVIIIIILPGHLCLLQYPLFSLGTLQDRSRPYEPLGVALLKEVLPGI